MTKKEHISSNDLNNRLSERFDSDAWIYLSDVRSATGFTREVRYADGLALGIWPSRGLEIQGFEIKVSRQDWKKELDNPKKSDEIARYCDKWWLVVRDNSIVPISELPKSWGLMIPRGKGLVVVQEAEKMEALPIDRSFMMSIIRHIVKTTVPADKITEQVNNRMADAIALERHRMEYQLKDAKNKAEELEKNIADFKFASGISINMWEGGKKIGHAVNMVLKFGANAHIEQLNYLKDRIEQIGVNITEALNKAESEMRLEMLDSNKM